MTMLIQSVAVPRSFLLPYRLLKGRSADMATLRSKRIGSTRPSL